MVQDQVVELDDGHGKGDGQNMMIKCSNLKRRKRKTKRAQGKGISYRAILFLSLKTP